MKISPLSLVFYTLVSTSTLVTAKDCNTNNPFASECVEYFGGGGCNNKLGEYTPTCAGNCFVYEFDSIHASGSEFKTTRCHAYSDKECKNEILDTGNQGVGYCQQALGAKSMKCYYDC